MLNLLYPITPLRSNLIPVNPDKKIFAVVKN